MQWVETTGRTVDEAKDRALDELGVDAADAEFEIVEEPRTGLFGRLRSEARVRARVRPTRPRAKEERRGRRRGRGESDSAGGPAAGGAGTASADAVKQTKAPRSRRGRGSSGSSGSSPDGQDRPGRSNHEEAKDMTEDVAMSEQGEVAGAFVTGVLERFGQEGTVSINGIDEDTIEVAVTGADLGLLIGPKGATLGALQDLARTVVQRQTGARNGRIVVDVGGYRQRRREALERFTRQVSAEVLSGGTRRALEPMSPADRKVVHDTANEIDGVYTASEGEEPRRRVVILPDES